MPTGNREVDDLTTVPDPSTGVLYIVKSNTDYKVAVGGANGLPYLNASAVIPVSLLGTGAASSSVFLRGDGSWATVPSSGGGTWGSITGTLSNQTDLNTALAGKAALSHIHSAADITSGVFGTARLGTGTANSSVFLRGDGTWAAPPGGGGATWGAITGTLSSQTDLQTALDAKAASSHSHDASAITTGTMATARLGSGTANSSTFLRGDGSWAVPSASVAWGGITGTLSNQTDLQTALNAKAASSHNHSAADLTSGTLVDARVSQSNVTQHQAALAIAQSQVTNLTTDLAAKAALSGATFTGAVVAPSFQVSSDARLKSSIANLEAAHTISKLRPVRYVYKPTNRYSWGLIAQEVEDVIPVAIKKDDNGYLSVDYSQIIAALICEVQALRKEVEELKNGRV